MKKVLPIEESPVFKTYAFWGDYLGVLQGNGYDVSGFIYNKFLILSYFMIGNRFGITAGYKLRKLFEKNVFGEIPNNFLRILKENIKTGKYAIITLNQSKIENRAFEFWHDWLIYGFNDDEKIIYALGYFEEHKGLSSFKTKLFTYEEFLDLLPPEGSRQGAKGKFYDNQFFWLPDGLELEKINLKRIKRKLYRLNNNLIYPWENQNLYRLFYFINSLINKNQKKAFELRTLKSILEHKKMMATLFFELSRDKKIVDEYKEIVKMAERMVMLAAKYNIQQNFNYEKKKDYAIRINGIFKNICHIEDILLKKLYESFKEE